MKRNAVDFSRDDVILWSALYECFGASNLQSFVAARDWSSLVKAVPTVDTEDDRFPDEYQATSLLSKFPFEIPGLDRRAVAMKKFEATELQCGNINREFVWERFDPVLLKRARASIDSVLGRFSLEEWFSRCGFGPGASTSVRRSYASQQQKWLLRGHGTEEVLPLYETFCRGFLGSLYDDTQFEVVEGNRVTTVPKNAKTDRIIAIEPDWNMFFQKGLGSYIRHRLITRLGLLTPQAQSVNRELARLGSIAAGLATLDLSSASDSIALGLVEYLLPPDWFKAMILCRSHKGRLDERLLSYEKISSMGNGFTFELETLIFWALCKSVNPGAAVSVYGDDIVCNSDDAGVISLLLDTCGFTLNAEKSFITGPFRESCGGHYWHGRDVTPCYIKESIRKGGKFDLQRHIRMANRLYKLAGRQYGDLRDSRFNFLWHVVLGEVPRSFWGPAELGDQCATVPFDMARPSWNRKKGMWTVKTVSTDLETVHEAHWGAVMYSLWGKVKETHEWESPLSAYRVASWCYHPGSCRWDRSDIWV